MMRPRPTYVKYLMYLVMGPVLLTLALPEW